jgi:hypothetical protein
MRTSIWSVYLSKIGIKLTFRGVKCFSLGSTSPSLPVYPGSGPHPDLLLDVFSSSHLDLYSWGSSSRVISHYFNPCKYSFETSIFGGPSEFWLTTILSGKFTGTLIFSIP